jgi:flavorubredoxin/flavin reductase (DIM6/NTAB) family NADH-FMN oxidoreductase RutF
MHITKKITQDLLWVGADDRRLAFFEGVYGVRDGVSYNSYLISDEKTILFDTVDKAVSGVYFENLAYGLGGRALDYLVISHMEPDHAATIEELCRRYPETTIVCNDKIKTMLSRFFPLDLTGRMLVVKEGDTLSTGRHNFTFVMAPMVHWPEVMMTYDTTDKILFSADAFGSFGALNGRIFADEVDFMHDCLDEARRYYTNIVGKYGPQVQNVLKKAAALEINYVCPLHSFVWRRHFGDFLEKYLQWSSYTPEVNGVMIAYASVYGHTENAANILAALLSDRGVKVQMYDTSVIPASYILSDAFKYSHLVFAATTYNAGVFVTMDELLRDIAAHSLKNRRVALIENGSWAPVSGKLMREILEPLKGMEFISAPVTVESSLTEDKLAELTALADTIAAELAPPAPAAPAAPVTGVDVAPGEVDPMAFNKLSYGVEVLTTRVDGKDYGCIINTAGQITAGDPKKITISVIKNNYTCDMVMRAGIFNLSILTEDAPFDTFKHFGFQSGRDVDKFAHWPEELRGENGLRYIGKNTNAMLSARVIDWRDCGTQMLYIAEVTEARVLSAAPSCTYSYYHAHIKPKKAAAAPAVEGWVCKVCGYFYEGKELPADFVCPICKHGPDDFEHVVPPAVKVKKGFLCKICGHFEEFDGDELPADYVCPICHHGRDDMEKTEITE